MSNHRVFSTFLSLKGDFFFKRLTTFKRSTYDIIFSSNYVEYWKILKK